MDLEGLAKSLRRGARRPAGTQIPYAKDGHLCHTWKRWRPAVMGHVSHSAMCRIIAISLCFFKGEFLCLIGQVLQCDGIQHIGHGLR
jgi:hypothetical protein